MNRILLLHDSEEADGFLFYCSSVLLTPTPEEVAR